jgi:hypothetical protein
MEGRFLSGFASLALPTGESFSVEQYLMGIDVFCLVRSILLMSCSEQQATQKVGNRQNYKNYSIAITSFLNHRQFVGVVDPSSYMVDAGGTPTTGADRRRSTTFGHRVHGTWGFYTLLYRVSGSGLAPQYVHEGVHPA